MGSYSCVCKPGFTENGLSCVGEQTHFSGHENAHRAWLLFYKHYKKSYVAFLFLHTVNNGGMGDGENSTSKTETASTSDGRGGGGNVMVTEGSSGGGGGGGVSEGVVAAVVVVLLLVVAALAVAAGLVGFALYRRKRLGQQQLTSPIHSIGMLMQFS